MNCPVDGTTLSVAERQGVEIDHCPQCRGVWLDRGELDKIIDRASRYERGRDRDDDDDDDLGDDEEEHAVPEEDVAEPPPLPREPPGTAAGDLPERS